MPAIRVGNCPCSWGVWWPDHPRQPPWQRYLDEVAGAGYVHTELGPPGYLPGDPDELADALAARGLAASGIALVAPLADGSSWPALAARIGEVAWVLRRLEAPWLILMDDSDAYADRAACRLDDAHWRTLEGQVGDAGRLAADLGLTLAFHPHAGTAVTETADIVRLLESPLAPDTTLCFDTGHHAACGGDPVGFITSWSDRIGYYHLKNIDGAVARRYRRGDLDPEAAMEAGLARPLDQGALDFGQVCAAIKATGFAGFCIVEQDLPGSDPLGCARRSRRFLEGRSWC